MAGLIACLTSCGCNKAWLARIAFAAALVIAALTASFVGIFVKQIALCGIFQGITALWIATTLAFVGLCVYCCRATASAAAHDDTIDDGDIGRPLSGVLDPKPERTWLGRAACIFSHALMLFCLVSAIALVVVTGMGAWLVQSTTPDMGRDIALGSPREAALASLTAPLDISMDKESGIVHISADDLADGYFGMGVVHAELRMWQMEFQRRVGSGSLSEAVGEGGLAVDKLMRTLGMYEAAEAAYAASPPDAKLALDSYTAGVNAYLATKPPLPLEFLLLGIAEMQPWRPADSLVWAKIMSYDLGGNMNSEMTRFKLKTWYNMTAERVDVVMPPYNASRFPTALSPADLGLGTATFGCKKPFVSDGLGGHEDAGAEEAARRARWNPAEGAGTGEESAVSRAIRIARDAARAAVQQAVPRGGAGSWKRGKWPSLSMGGSGIRPVWELGALGASNDWVVGGNRTASGKPLLCNDPHLALMAPSIWLALSLSAKQGGQVTALNPNSAPGADSLPVEQAGASFVGLPGIVIGRNDHIAWGVTNVGADVQDLYIMKPPPAGFGAAEYYAFQNGAERYQTTAHIIKVKGKADYTMVVRRSRFGPVVTDNGLFPDMQNPNGDSDSGNGGGNGSSSVTASLRWVSTDTSVNDTTIASFLRIGQARNHSEWTEALRMFIAPSQNMVYADTAGHIAYRTTGLVPVRQGGRDGRWPVAGDGKGNDWDWTGWIPFDEMPATLDPPEGFIVTANNRITPSAYPHLITADWDAGSNGYRAERITDLVCQAGQGTSGKLTPDDMARIQKDQVSYVARDIVGAVRAAMPLSKISDDAKSAVSTLEAWDFNATIGSKEQTTLMRLYAGMVKLAANATGSDSYWPDAVFAISAMTNGDPLCEDGTCASFFAAAMNNATEDDGAPEEWGVPGRHMATFRHQVLGASPLACMADREIGHGGDFSTINVGHGDLASKHFGQSAGSSYRQIVDLSDMPSSRFLNPLGQSGAPFDHYYDNLLKAWQEVTYLPMRAAPRPGAMSQKVTQAA